MNQSTTDLWDNIRLGFETQDTEHLQKLGRQLRHICQLDDERQRRLGTNYPGWAGVCGRPTVGLIRITLLLRGVAPTF
ncbi:hypothetical protein HER32_06780 [Hymenobacter sp. BT18]|uniref:hypothetical protein n=1 Tax=Hymenobacter sp. BT18 TaxID=2835648 RepID=UPI00143EE90A|nr:hypothetical protein [Hymenobacter sp. BT18]QIX60898.1 hypothetical protein HER32_06780 [Hymenobacter sp. BT18]